MTSEPATEWEYKALRDEILQNQRNCIQILAVSIAATGVILGFSVPNKESYLCLTPLIVLLPALYIFISQVESSFRIGAYIRLFIETKAEGLQYESLWAERKMACPSQKEIYAANALRIFQGLGFICLIISFAYWNGAITPLLAIVGLFIVIVVHSTLLMNRAINPQRHTEFWEPRKKE